MPPSSRNRHYWRALAAAGLLSSCLPLFDLRMDASAQDAAQPIGLRARFDRPEPVFAVGETLALTVTTDRPASIEVIEISPAGDITRVLPVPGSSLLTEPGRPLHLPPPGTTLRAGPPPGSSELRIIAREPGGRAASADMKLAGNHRRQEVTLRYRTIGP